MKNLVEESKKLWNENAIFWILHVGMEIIQDIWLKKRFQ